MRKQSVLNAFKLHMIILFMTIGTVFVSDIAYAGKDPYSVLGAKRTDSLEEIQKSFRRLAQKYHPDRNKEPNALARFQEIQSAWATIKDSHSRSSEEMFRQSHSTARETNLTKKSTYLSRIKSELHTVRDVFHSWAEYNATKTSRRENFIRDLSEADRFFRSVDPAELKKNYIIAQYGNLPAIEFEVQSQNFEKYYSDVSLARETMEFRNIAATLIFSILGNYLISVSELKDGFKHSSYISVFDLGRDGVLASQSFGLNMLIQLLDSLSHLRGFQIELTSELLFIMSLRKNINDQVMSSINDLPEDAKSIFRDALQQLKSYETFSESNEMYFRSQNTKIKQVNDLLKSLGKAPKKTKNSCLKYFS